MPPIYEEGTMKHNVRSPEPNNNKKHMSFALGGTNRIRLSIPKANFDEESEVTIISNSSVETIDKGIASRNSIM